MNIDYEKLEKIGITIVENQKIHDLILSISEKGFFDYLIPTMSILLAAYSIYMGYRSFDKRVQELKGEQIILKDIDKLYEAANSFFSYIDAAGLFFSLSEKRAIRTLEQKEHSSEFKERYDFADKDFFQKISKIKEAIFILKTLDQNYLVEQLQELNDFSIKERRKQILIFERSDNNSELNSIKENHQSFRIELASKTENITGEFIKIKKKISKP